MRFHTLSYTGGLEMDFRAMRHSIIVFPDAGDKGTMGADQPKPFGGVGKEVL